MFNKRRRRERELLHEVVQKMVDESEKQKVESRRTLSVAREVVVILNGIREKNHIVSDLRKVFGGS